MTFRTRKSTVVLFGALLAGCGDHLSDFDVADVGDAGARDTGADVARADASDASDVVASDTGSDSGVHDAGTDVVTIDAGTDVTAIDAGTDAFDARSDATRDAGADVASDVRPDAISLDAAADAAADVGDAGADAAPAWRHSIVIDGSNDFASSSESFATTSTGYTAYVTWDSSNLYIGYDGADIASGSMTRWLFAFFDTDPGTGLGATASPVYNTETVGFPTGFAPEFYLRWRASNDFQTIEQYSAGAWSTSSGTPQTFQLGTYVEFRIPLSAINNATHLGVTILMMNEAATVESAYGGIYSGNFTDGYHATVPVTSYLLVDLASTVAPNTAANRRP